MDNNLLTVSQAARKSGIAERALWNTIYKGALLVVRIGPFKRPRVRRADLENYLKDWYPNSAQTRP